MGFWSAMHLPETSPFDLFIYAITLIMLYSPNYSLIVSTKDYAVPCCLNAYTAFMNGIFGQLCWQNDNEYSFEIPLLVFKRSLELRVSFVEKQYLDFK